MPFPNRNRAPSCTSLLSRRQAFLDRWGKSVYRGERVRDREGDLSTACWIRDGIYECREDQHLKVAMNGIHAEVGCSSVAGSCHSTVSVAMPQQPVE